MAEILTAITQSQVPSSGKTSLAYKLRSAFSAFTAEVTLSGNISNITVAIEGGLTENNWYTLASHALTTAELNGKCALFTVDGTPVLWVRGNISTMTGTGNATVDLIPNN